MFLLYFLLALTWMSVLDPGRDHVELAYIDAIAVERSHGAFGERSVLETLALVVAIQYRESRFRSDAVGDHGQSFCSMQIHSSSGGEKRLLGDPEACVSLGLSLLASSSRLDPAHPVAAYARGSRWRSGEAQKISDDRVQLARSLLARTLP